MDGVGLSLGPPPINAFYSAFWESQLWERRGSLLNVKARLLASAIDFEGYPTLTPFWRDFLTEVGPGSRVRNASQQAPICLLFNSIDLICDLWLTKLQKWPFWMQPTLCRLESQTTTCSFFSSRNLVQMIQGWLIFIRARIHLFIYFKKKLIGSDLRWLQYWR